MKNIFFTPGPSELFFTVEEHIKNGLKKNIYSISHRSKEFKIIYADCVNNLKELISIPDGYHVSFLSSANEIWERLIQNLVLNDSGHLVNGAFSKKFYEFALLNNINAKSYIFDKIEYATDNIIQSHELLSLTLNETSTGIMSSENKISDIRSKVANSLISLDCVSGLPSIPFNISDVDTFYFSVQKCFGLPSGLGVWIYNDRCLEKHYNIKEKKITGTYHSLEMLHKMSLKNQTPETPNVLAIYVLSKVLEDMNNIGLDMIIRDTNYKSSLIYDTINKHKDLSTFIKNKKIQSKTVAVADTKRENIHYINKLKKKGLIIGKGYDSTKNQIRIANFPTHSKEVFELLCDELNKL
ncbi:MAG: phosphoserine aminotransferase [Cytophagia bacterium]|jgi:phosphoserine aminotransferase|nr:phosphoserine aminotransferase [Cytophagia bacterium]